MRGLDVVWVIVSPSSAHSFRVFVVRDDITVLSKILAADCALASLFGDLSVRLQDEHSFSLPQTPGAIFIDTGRHSTCRDPAFYKTSDRTTEVVTRIRKPQSNRV